LKLKDEPAYKPFALGSAKLLVFFSAVSAIFKCANSLIGQSGEEMHIRTDHPVMNLTEFLNLQKKTKDDQSKVVANN